MCIQQEPDVLVIENRTIGSSMSIDKNKHYLEKTLMDVNFQEKLLCNMAWVILPNVEYVYKHVKKVKG